MGFLDRLLGNKPAFEDRVWMNAQEQVDKKRRNIENYARSSAEWMQLNMSE